MSARAGKSPSAMDAGLCRGWCRNAPPAPCPSTQPPFDLHPQGAADAGSICEDFLRGAGGFALQCRDEVSGGASCLPLQLHGHARAHSPGQPSSPDCPGQPPPAS